jgi:hypothetical protein
MLTDLRWYIMTPDGSWFFMFPIWYCAPPWNAGENETICGDSGPPLPR